jgi:nucleoside-diphosphate-sugar epimerase
MRILITGGSGMLGRAILSAFKESTGDHFIYSPPRSDLDLLDLKSVSHYLAKNQIDSIIHCAALVGGIQANIANPFEYLNTNIRLDSNLMSAAQEERVTNFLYVASSCMYPANTTQPMKESQILTGEPEKTNEGYALAKIVGTKTVEIVGEELNWRTLILSNMYGPGDKYNYAESHLIAAIIKKVTEAKSNNSSYIQMWGTGAVRREFTYVDDIADYISKLIFNLDKIPQIMNVGIGVDYSVREYYELVSKALSYEGEIRCDSSKPEGMFSKLMDSSIAVQNGWIPTTDIRSGLQTTIEDFMMNHQGTK